MTKKTLASDLRELLSKPIDPSLFPYKVGSKINIGSYSIAKCKSGGYTIKCYKTNQIIEETFSKAAAIAIAKSLNKNKHVTPRIKHLDDIIMKNKNDCMFYKHTLDKTKDETKWEVTATRYDISLARLAEAREKLETFIL